ncbi:3'-5' exoribonuclease domain-containing protein [Actinopolyspora halophila]|uniref:3'-5' exoribonuclease domain-containing protein n=1 Tax=Actinopolyspora halophila TaxID=1850 RepID=UPI0003673B1B|nr:3'-5' exoribonuclease [Actinopolyspora halophila]
MSARYFYDCEFHEDGSTIDLLSIGIVADDGREYYAINVSADWDRAYQHPFLAEHVIPNLVLDEGHAKPHAQIADEVADFLRAVPGEIELWAHYGAYDHVALAQLWGTMMDLPQGIPMYTHDLQQELDRLGVKPWELPRQDEGEHNALADARHLRDCYDAVQRIRDARMWAGERA